MVTGNVQNGAVHVFKATAHMTAECCLVSGGKMRFASIMLSVFVQSVFVLLSFSPAFIHGQGFSVI